MSSQKHLSDWKVRKAIEELQKVIPLLRRSVLPIVREKKAHLLSVYGDFVGSAKALIPEHGTEIEKMDRAARSYFQAMDERMISRKFYSLLDCGIKEINQLLAFVMQAYKHEYVRPEEPIVDEKYLFNFVSGNLKPILRRDYRDAEFCFKNKRWKPAIVLYGSILEAILTYFLKKQKKVDLIRMRNKINSSRLRNQRKIPSSLKWYTFSDMIDVAEGLGLITSELGRADWIREYRNLIHPAVELRGSIKPEENRASISRSLLDLVLKDIIKRTS